MCPTKAELSVPGSWCPVLLPSHSLGALPLAPAALHTLCPFTVADGSLLSLGGHPGLKMREGAQVQPILVSPLPGRSGCPSSHLQVCSVGSSQVGGQMLVRGIRPMGLQRTVTSRLVAQAGSRLCLPHASASSPAVMGLCSDRPTS